MTIRELRDYLNGLEECILDKNIVLDDVYDEFYSKYRKLDLEILGLNSQNEVVVGIDNVEISKSEYISIVDTKYYEVTEIK